MAELTRTRTPRTMQRLQRELQSLFDDFLAPWEEGAERSSAVWTPRMDAVETDRAYEFRMDLPGVAKEDVSIDVEGNRLTVRGERKEERRDEGENVMRVERAYGRFYRSVVLPQAAQSEDAEATFENGVLRIRVPKAEEKTPKKIDIA